MSINAEGLVGWWMASLLLVAHLAAASVDLRLVDAVKKGDTEAVRALVKEQADVNARQPDGTTALHWAVRRDALDATDLLIRAGAQVNAADDYGVTPLWLACLNGTAAMVQKLLNAGANSNSVMPSGETALMMAARTGNTDAVKALLERGAAVNAKEASRGQTALMWASAEGHANVARLLIAHGDDVHARSTAGFTPLLLAGRTGDLDTARVLLAAGADVNEATSDHTTALMVATIRGHIALAEFLLDRGADPNVGPGFTPLHWAAGARPDLQADGTTLKDEGSEWSVLHELPEPAKLELAKALLAHGADPNARATAAPRAEGAAPARGDLIGATPFLMAAKAGDASVMRLLAAGGADPMLTNTEKTTALMMAAGVIGSVGLAGVAESRALEAVKTSVELGNDVNAVNAAGETALHGATFRGRLGSDTIVQFLVDKGAKVNVKNNRGWTPLAIAEGIYGGTTDSRSPSAAELLRKAGADPTPPDFVRDATAVRRPGGK